MVDETTRNTVGSLFPNRGKPDGGCAENPVRSERKQRYWLLPGVRFPLKGAFIMNAPFFMRSFQNHHSNTKTIFARLNTKKRPTEYSVGLCGVADGKERI